MGIKPKEILVHFGTASIPVDTIVEYRLDKNIETVEQRKKRKKTDASVSGVGGLILGSIATAPATAIAVMVSTTGIPALAIMGGGMLAGTIIGNKKGKNKFEQKPENQTLDHSTLVVTCEGGTTLSYCADNCNFDIYAAYQELTQKFPKAKRLREIKSKICRNDGEDEVEYAIKWCLADLKENVVSIEKDCESKYRYGCILLRKSNLIDEPQEYDHILVSNAGVVLIETKHWKGKIEIRPDGKWLRDPNDYGKMIGVENPAFQMQRHEMLIKGILPNVPVYSLLCFSNKSAIIKGKGNFTGYPIVYVDQLKDTLLNLLVSKNTSDGAIDYIVSEIEKHKINKIDRSEIE